MLNRAPPIGPHVPLYCQHIRNEAWVLLERRLRQGYSPIILERVVELELSRSMFGSYRFRVLNAAIYLLRVSFPLLCMAIIPRIELALQTALDGHIAAARQLHADIVRVRGVRPYDRNGAIDEVLAREMSEIRFESRSETRGGGSQNVGPLDDRDQRMLDTRTQIVSTTTSIKSRDDKAVSNVRPYSSLSTSVRSSHENQRLLNNGAYYISSTSTRDAQVNQSLLGDRSYPLPSPSSVPSRGPHSSLGNRRDEERSDARSDSTVRPEDSISVQSEQQPFRIRDRQPSDQGRDSESSQSLRSYYTDSTRSREGFSSMTLSARGQFRSYEAANLPRSENSLFKLSDQNGSTQRSQGQSHRYRNPLSTPDSRGTSRTSADTSSLYSTPSSRPSSRRSSITARPEHGREREGSGRREMPFARVWGTNNIPAGAPRNPIPSETRRRRGSFA